MSEADRAMREQSLIGLLAAGHTDASAARELGISPRSVSGMVRSLMDRLGAENRFQLGLALGALERAGAGPASYQEPNPAVLQEPGRAVVHEPGPEGAGPGPVAGR